MSSFFGKLKNFFVRLGILAVVLIWNSIRLNNIDKSSDELRDKLSRILGYFNLLTPSMKEYIEDPSLILLFGLIINLIFNIIALFGYYKGAVFSGIFFLINIFLYFNPFLPEYQLSLLSTRIEVITNIGILLSIFMFAYYPYETKNVSPLSEEELQEIEEVDDSKKNSKKKKK